MEGKRIQFGRTQGWLILALGFLLVAFQIMFSLHLFPGSVQGDANTNASPTLPSSHTMFFVPGIAGTITIVVGCYFLLQDRFKTRDPNPPAKTKSGLPM